LVATVGSTYVHTEEVTGLSVVAAVPVGLLATALLVGPARLLFRPEARLLGLPTCTLLGSSPLGLCSRPSLLLLLLLADAILLKVHELLQRE
jgi:hypothetical protein